jgi:hypothetical protein
LSADVVKGKESEIFLRNYRKKFDDVLWAQKGLVATVINGEAITVVQNRITYAGFNSLVVTPLRADKVFIRSTEGDDALSIVGGAAEFFKLVFSNWSCWEKDGGLTSEARVCVCNCFGGEGCASVVTSMPLNTWMNADLPGMDHILWTTILSIGSLRITTW